MAAKMLGCGAFDTNIYGKVLFASLNFRNFSVGEHEYLCLPFSIPFNLVDRFMPVFSLLFLPSIIIITMKRSRIIRISKWIFFPLRFYSFRLFVIIAFAVWMCFSGDIFSFCSCCYRLQWGRKFIIFIQHFYVIYIFDLSSRKLKGWTFCR